MPIPRRQLAVAVVLVAAGLTGGAKVFKSTVMTEGDTAVGCLQEGCTYAAFRIPGLVDLGNGTLLAFAEGRKWGCGDFGGGTHPHRGQHDLVVRRSITGGRSWEPPLRNIFDAIGDPRWKHIDADNGVDTGNAIWDPTPLWDATTDTVWVFFNGPGREREDCSRGWCSTWAMSSADRGVSWSDAVNLTGQCQREGNFFGRAGNTPGNGHGVQLSSGRLVVPMYAGSPAGASTCFSDDHGTSWTASPFSPNTNANSDEIEIAELNSGDGKRLYMTIRHDAPPYGRQFSLSADGGVTWGERLEVQVPDPGCKGGVVQDPVNNAMVLSTAASCTVRGNQTIFLSTNNGAPGSWEYRQLVDAKSGYSTLQMCGGMIANLYEANTCNLTLALVDPKEMIADGRKPAIPCADSHCPSKVNGGPGFAPPPPPAKVDPHTLYCGAPPKPPRPPPSPQCQAALDDVCVAAKECFPTPSPYPGFAPLKALDSLGCAAEPPKPWPHGVPQGPCPAALTTPAWRCYSNLAMNPSKTAWSNAAPHPNAYCSHPGAALEAALQKPPCAATNL